MVEQILHTVLPIPKREHPSNGFNPFWVNFEEMFDITFLISALRFDREGVIKKTVFGRRTIRLLHSSELRGQIITISS